MDAEYSSPLESQTLEQFLQSAVQEISARYHSLIRDIVGFMQEIPADLLLQADRIENDGAEGMNQAEVAGYANGVRYAAYLVATSIAAHMEMDRALVEGEFGE